MKSRLDLPFWYRLTRVVPDKGLLNAHVCVCGMQELKDYLNRVGEVSFADAHKEHLNEGLAVSHCLLTYFTLSLSMI